MKWLLSAAAAVLLLILLAGVVLFFTLDGLTRRGIERGTSYATGTPTTLKSARLSVRQGELRVDDLAIANPEGFNSPHFLQLGDAYVAVALRSLLREQVVIPRLHLEGIDLNLERRDGRNNYDVILENLEKLSGPPEEQPRDGKKYVIHELLVTGVIVKAALFSLDGSEPRVITLRLEDIRLTDVGSETEGGVLLEQLSGIVIEAVLEAVLEQAGNALPDVIAGSLRSGLAGLGDIGGFDFDLETITEGFGGILGEVTGEAVEGELEQAGETLRRGVEEGLGGILGGRDRQRRNGEQDNREQNNDNQ